MWHISQDLETDTGEKFLWRVLFTGQIQEKGYKQNPDTGNVHFETDGGNKVDALNK